MIETTETAVKKWEEMSPLEKDGWLAENVMRWRRVKSPHHDALEDDGRTFCVYQDKVLRGRAYRLAGGLYSHSYAEWALHGEGPDKFAHAHEMEEAIKAKGLTKAYVSALRDVMFYNYGITHDDNFAFIHATPEQRAYAAYLTLTGAHI